MKNHPDRLRRISIGCLVIAGLGIAFDTFSHGPSQFHGVILMAILLGTALEQIRLELRDLREEVLKNEAER